MEVSYDNFITEIWNRFPDKEELLSSLKLEFDRELFKINNKPVKNMNFFLEYIRNKGNDEYYRYLSLCQATSMVFPLTILTKKNNSYYVLDSGDDMEYELMNHGILKLTKTFDIVEKATYHTIHQIRILIFYCNNSIRIYFKKI